MVQPHDWKECRPVVITIATGEINDADTYIAQAFFDALDDRRKQTFHEATCQQGNRAKHHVLINRFTQYLRDNGVA